MSSINADLAVELSMGSAGFSLVTATTLQTGPYSRLQVVANAVFTSISGNNIGGTWSATTIPAGTSIVGPITSFQLASGAVIAYNGIINS
jgi:hypothetical protein